MVSHNLCKECLNTATFKITAGLTPDKKLYGTLFYVIMYRSYNYSYSNLLLLCSNHCNQLILFRFYTSPLVVCTVY